MTERELYELVLKDEKFRLKRNFQKLGVRETIKLMALYALVRVYEPKGRLAKALKLPLEVAKETVREAKSEEG